MDKFLIPPDSSGYSARRGNEIAAVRLDGGRGRYRRDKVGATAEVVCNWRVDRQGYDYICAFFNTRTGRGALPFLIDLILDSATTTEHTAYFVPGSFNLSEQRGYSYTLSASLEVEPVEPDLLTDGFLLLTYGLTITEEELVALFTSISDLMTVYWPTIDDFDNLAIDEEYGLYSVIVSEVYPQDFTFTRASDGTYRDADGDVVTATTDESRFTYG